MIARNMNIALDGFIDVNGVRLHYLDWGGAGNPIVILHATGFLGRMYRPFAEALHAIGHPYTLDQRGHGDSGAAPNLEERNWDYTMNDLGGFISAMGWKGVRAFGHSSGATAIGSLACERPDLIARAVLAEPIVFESPQAPELEWRNPFIERTLKRRRVFDSIDAMYANFEHKPPYDTWHREILRDYCEFGTRAMADGKRELKCAPEIEAQIYRTSRDFDGLGRILRADRPMLILFGERSDSLGVTLAEKIAANLKQGRVVKIPNAGHFLPMEQPEIVARLSAEFLSEE
ncbi:MAG: alpha/beta fold hydrolase [Candidatus Binataceae bacterium]